MKNKFFLLFFILLFIIILSFISNKINPKNIQITKPNTSSLPISPSPKIPIRSSKSIFIPYWASEINKGDLLYDSYYYFGISPTKDGQVKDEAGLQNISRVDSLPEKQKKLVLRMLDSSVAEVLLKNKSAQTMLISQVRNNLSKNAFSGLVIDLEVPFTLQASMQKQITDFVQQMCTAIHTDYKSCDMLIYGDVVYRKRPYDLEKLGNDVDKILLMAYDFHKSGGEPGPNFPFARRSLSEGGSFDYGYDFKTMINDVSRQVPKEKIEVVFGMYGYDWTLNEQGTPLKMAKALTLKEIQVLNSKMLFITGYKLHTNEAKEKYIEYKDQEGAKHVIWYEDEESVAVKTEYLQKMGIWQTSFWALSYF